MAVRTPSAYVAYDDKALRPGSYVKASAIDAIVENQQWIMDKRSTLISAAFPFLQVSNATGTTKQVAKWHVHHETGGYATQIACYASVFYTTDVNRAGKNATVTFAGGLLASSAAMTLSMGASATAAVWSAESGAFNIDVDTEDYITMTCSADQSGGAVAFYVLGVLIRTAEL